MMSWDIWWVWAAAGLVLLILELLAPGVIFLGFGIGAGVIALVLAVAPGMITSFPVALLVFAVVSLIAWFAMRKLAGERKGQKKIWDTDINEG